MSNKRSMYAKLDDEYKAPLFTVTPGKNCRMFPYLWTAECAAFYGPKGDPKDNPFRCKAQGPVDANQEYLGFPVAFSYNLSGEKGCDQASKEYPHIIGERQ